MRAAPEDRLATDSGGRGFRLRYVVVLLAVLAIGFWFWRTSTDQETPEPVAVVEAVEETVIEPAELPPAPDIPVPPKPAPVAEAPAEIEEPVAPPLPPLAASDELVREQLAAAGIGPNLAQLDGSQNLVATSAALIDGFSRGIVLRKLLPVARPSEGFTVEQRGERTFMNPASYRRYDNYAEAIATIDAGVVVDNFHRLRPLYEQAYAQLGLKPEEFDNAVIRMLDRVLATPEIEQPIELTRKSVMYRYADPQLEQLSAVQKQLLRMGPDNIRRIKAQARIIRSGLLTE
jgi:hypothetical protein